MWGNCFNDPNAEAWSPRLFPGRRLRLVQWRSQSATLSASDLHNARSLMSIAWYMIWFRTWQIKTWIKAEIRAYIGRPHFDILHTPRPLIASKMTIPVNSMTSQMSAKAIQIATLLRAFVNGADIVWKYADWHLIIELYLHAQGFYHGCLHHRYHD